MTKTQLEERMGGFEPTGRIDDESLLLMAAKRVSSDKPYEKKLEMLMNVLLMTAKSRNMSLHSLENETTGGIKKSEKGNLCHILQILSGKLPPNTKVIVCIGIVNTLTERLRVKKDKNQ